MLLILTLLTSFILLIVSTSQGYFVAYPLLATLGLLVAVLMKRGFRFRALMGMAIAGSRKALSLMSILLLIGVVIAVWMAAGTVPAMVYYGLQIIHPSAFVFFAFVLTSVVSLLVGTSFGAVGTIGIALMIMASGSEINPNIVAGAIIAGAYVGDRCSPMSSSANFVAALTQTDLYGNVRNMVSSAHVTLALSGIAYLILSWFNPVTLGDDTISQAIAQEFNLHPIVLLPALMIVGLSLVRMPVKRLMVVSIGAGVAIAISLQGYSLLQIMTFGVTGFDVADTSPLQSILIGGGVMSMVKVCLVITLSTALAGIFSGTEALSLVQTLLKRAHSRSSLFLSTSLVGTAAAAFGCTQTIAILLTQQLVEPRYRQCQQDDATLALDMENTVVVLSPLIPWNIAGLVPATLLTVDAGFIPYAIFLYLLPVVNWIQLRFGDRHLPPCSLSAQQHTLCNLLPRKKINS